MKFTPKKINAFTLLKLPAAYLTGIRVKKIDASGCHVQVKYKWINQNPFKSMFWAVQGMAAELTTGVLMMDEIQKSGKRISMLVTNMDASFTKKAVGKISFVCEQRTAIQKAIADSVATGEGQKVVLSSKGIDAKGDEVSAFNFEWSVKVKG